MNPLTAIIYPSNVFHYDSERRFYETHERKRDLVFHPATFPVLLGHRWDNRWTKYTPDFYDTQTGCFIEVTTGISSRLRASAPYLHSLLSSYPHLRLNIQSLDHKEIAIAYVEYWVKRDRPEIKTLGRERAFLFTCLACMLPAAIYAAIESLDAFRLFPEPSIPARWFKYRQPSRRVTRLRLSPEKLASACKILLSGFDLPSIRRAMLYGHALHSSGVDLDETLADFDAIQVWPSGFEIVNYATEFDEAKRLYDQGWSTEQLASKYGAYKGFLEHVVTTRAQGWDREAIPLW